MLTVHSVLRSAVISAIPLILSGCRWPTGLPPVDCDLEQRYARVTGGITEGTTEVASVTITVGAVRGPRDFRRLTWMIWAPFLEGHVTSVTLINSTQRVPMLLDIPVYTPGQARVISGQFIEESGTSSPPLDGIFEIVSTNRAAIELTTDLADQPLITIPLTVEEMMDWFRDDRC